MKFFPLPERPANLEPGIIQMLRVFAVASFILQPLSRRVFGTWMGAAAPLEANLLLTVPPGLVFLLLVWLPWFPRNLGRLYLPLTLAVACIPALVEKFITLSWFLPVDALGLVPIGLVLRIWFEFQVATFITAWQYDMRSVIFVGIALNVADAFLSLPFVIATGPIYTFFVGLVTSRLLITTGFSLAVAWLMQRQRAQRAELESANRKLALNATAAEQLAISHERNRMARELHDTLAHSLSAVSVQLEAVNALWQVEPESAHAILEQATAGTRSGLTEARRALHSLRASPLEDLGLALAISNLAESVASRANLKLELEISPGIEGLQPQVEQCIYRITQEALENVTRHAQATNLRVGLEKTNAHFTLTVADNGRGFDASLVNGGHFGLKGMYERAEMANAKLSVDTAPQEGTRVKLEITD